MTTCCKLHFEIASLVAQMVKASAYNAGDPGSIPGLGRSPGKGIGNPLQYSCLENSVDGWRSQLGYSPWGRKESDTTERLHFKIYKDNYKEERCLMHPKANPNTVRPWGYCSGSENPLEIQRAPSLLSHSASVYLLFSFLGLTFSASQSSGRWQPQLLSPQCLTFFLAPDIRFLGLGMGF